MTNAIERKSAGNRGDVVKHAALLACVEKLRQSRRFIYAETHAGAPFTRLKPKGAWMDGILTLREKKKYDPAGEYHDCIGYTPHLDRYAGTAGLHYDVREGVEYPGSANLVRAFFNWHHAGFNAHLFDTSRGVTAMLRADGFANVECEDGYSGLTCILDREQPLDFAFIDPFAVEGRDTMALTMTVGMLMAQKVPFLVWLPASTPLTLIPKGLHVFNVEFTGSLQRDSLTGCKLVVPTPLALTIRAVAAEVKLVLNWLTTEVVT
jgi:23S rRNA A2030 N6-methylase RlmJ